MNTTDYAGLHLKTDWTARDYYNAADLNRVGAVVAYLRDKLRANGMIAANVTPKLDWSMADIPNAAQMRQYLDDVQAIKAAYYGVQAIPSTMDRLNAEGANNIEKALLEVENLLNRTIAARVAQCGINRTGGIL